MAKDGEMCTVPDFWIVGAPKCGTTALHTYLASHPGIFMARKEIHFFGSDLDSLHFGPAPTYEEYLSEFQGAQEGQLVGETAVWYLFSKTAAQEIRASNPNGKIIILLRNPIIQMHSLHGQMRAIGIEPVSDFSLAAERGFFPEGERGKEGPDLPWFLRYEEVASFAGQVRRFLDVFGDEHVLVLLQEDMLADRLGTYKLVLNFLGLGSTSRQEFPLMNVSNRPRSFFLARAIRHPPWILRKILRLTLPQSFRKHIALTLDRLNRKPEPRTPIPPAMREELLKRLLPDIEELGSLIQRDLKDWIA